MCGITGVLNRRPLAPVSVAALERMMAALRHRGPDEFGIYRDAHVGLGNARLSVIDMAGGQQPIGNEAGTVWIVFNGEIFNYLELRQGLEARGHRFATQSDTEVIVHLYEEYGSACLDRLNGQFALALWDGRDHSLFLARDRMGICPLFYAAQADRLIFGSEVKAVLAAPGMAAELDPEALRQVFTFWSVVAPRSIFRGIRELPPGHYLLARDGAVTVQPYWAIEFTEAPTGRSEDDYLQEFRALLTDAAHIRLRADVPVGAYLSGGLDSSVIAALLRNHAQCQMDTFSIAFSDPAFDESAQQRRMASFLGTRHHDIRCAPEDIGRIFPDVIEHIETPVLRTAPAPMFLLSALVNQHGRKVILTGEGADELLAGYDLFKEVQIRRFWARQPESQLRPLLLRRLYPEIPRLAQSAAFVTAFFKRRLLDTASPIYSHLIRWGNATHLLRFLAEDVSLANEPAPDEAPVDLPDHFESWSAIAKAQYLEIRTFMSPYLLSSQGDRVAMAHSVEARYPYLDHRVVEFCSRLPTELKLRGLRDKWLLRQLGRTLLPLDFWQRRKRPYRAPIQRSFFTGGRAVEYVDALLAPEAIRRGGYFKPGAVNQLAGKARGAAALSEVEDMALVGILSTQLLDQLFVRRASPPAPLERSANFKLVDLAPASV